MRLLIVWNDVFQHLGWLFRLAILLPVRWLA